MKYLTSDLYFFDLGENRYNDHDDKFLIGILNNNKTKLKDIITGEIVEHFHFLPITRLNESKNGGNDVALGYITGFTATNASISQHILVEKINSILSKDVLEEKEIIKIKEIINKAIIKNYEKKSMQNNLLNERERELKKYSIDEGERDF